MNVVEVRIGWSLLTTRKPASAARRLARIAVAAQIGSDDGELFGKARGQFMPHDMILRRAVQQEQRRPAAANDGVYRGPGGSDNPGLKVLEHRVALFPAFACFYAGWMSIDARARLTATQRRRVAAHGRSSAPGRHRRPASFDAASFQAR